MIDIHSHILPGVDDGSQSMDESLQLAKVYVELGYTDVIATPHYFKGRYTSTYNENKEILDLLQEQLKRNGVSLNIHLGNEIYYDSQIVNWLKEKKVSTMASSDYVLIEFPMNGALTGIANFTYELQMSGYIPIIAHVERYSFFWDHWDELRDFVKKGVLLQMNADSICSKNDKIRKLSKRLLEEKLIHIIATDSHQLEWRGPNRKSCFDELRRLGDDEYIQEILHENPKRLIENRRLIVRAPKQAKRSFFSRLFKR